MWTVPLRDPRVVTVVVLVFAALAAWGLLELETEVAVRTETLFTLPWGNGDREVGRAEAGGKVFGPRSFAVFRDQVFIADTFNARVLVVRLDGQVTRRIDLRGMPAPPGDQRVVGILPGTLPVTVDVQEASSETDEAPPVMPWVNDIAMGPDGRIYVADAAANRVLVITPDGQSASALALPGAAPEVDPNGDAIWLVERLVVDDRGLLYLSHAYLSDAILTRRVTRFEPDGAHVTQLSSVSLEEGRRVRVDEGSYLPVPVNSFAVDGRGLLYVEGPGGSPFSRVVRVYKRDGDLAYARELTRPHLIRRAALIGVDGRGWIYLALAPGAPQGAVAILPGETGTLYEVEAGWREGFEANVYARLHDDNELYVARPEPDGWTLERWEVDRRHRLVPSGRR